MQGHCTCGDIRYRLTDRPLFTHCCHCRWCQRETGSAFVLNALIETACLEVTEGSTEAVETPSESGRGQIIHRCPRCRVALWSHYSGAGALFAFVRVGTLEDPDRVPPDIHIFTASKQPWVVLPPGVPAMEAFYRRSEHWPDWALARREAVLAHHM
ncbi:GFA family protein [Oceanicola sp. 502str15]|uniref:GFA family protein n=1 Tax=Oceanicola sp. 502str15 TaxID=2696061 RepID=UPI0020955F91|nr:GFA family protein [Oceanicola sp. 502str15]MCO6383603.1 aldehyde-activating protein [Oceanicola sp. 502str15]